MIDDPLGCIGTPELGVLFTIAFGGVFVFGRLDMAFRPPVPPKPVKLETPWNQGNASELIEYWRSRGQLAAVRRWVIADFPLLLVYSAALAAVGSLAGRAGACPFDDEDARSIGAIFTYAGWLAGLFDVFEDVGMLAMLKGRVEQPVPGLTSAFAVAKWVCLGVAGLGSSVLLVASLIAAVT